MINHSGQKFSVFFRESSVYSQVQREISRGRDLGTSCSNLFRPAYREWNRGSSTLNVSVDVSSLFRISTRPRSLPKLLSPFQKTIVECRATVISWCKFRVIGGDSFRNSGRVLDSWRNNVGVHSELDRETHLQQDSFSLPYLDEFIWVRRRRSSIFPFFTMIVRKLIQVYLYDKKS